jgi:anti-sigma regulatory factor (Ser/Thr protein kinase)
MTRTARHTRADAYAASTGGDPGSQTTTHDRPRVCERALAATPDAAKAARQFTRNTLRQWELDDLNDDALLVVSELVTNAVIHGVPDVCEDTDTDEQPILLRLVNKTTSVLCVVHDTSCAAPYVTGGDALAENCRGLHIVAELSSTWGWTPSKQHGKYVWAVLEATHQPAGARQQHQAID